MSVIFTSGSVHGVTLLLILPLEWGKPKDPAQETVGTQGSRSSLIHSYICLPSSPRLLANYIACHRLQTIDC